ncbi:MAG: ATP-binding protein [Proteobacteria bacterium]|nr:ATP-binding protein [Pseudomonadota bacterium]
MDCILQKTLQKKFVNNRGITRIEPEWDEDAVRECPICGGIKHLEIMEEGYRTVRPCPGMFALKRIDAYNRAGVPSRFMNATFDNYKLDRIHEPSTIKTFIQKIKNYQKGASGFLLEGGPGTGKTHLLCAAIRYLTLELGVSCLYIDYSNLLSDIRASYSQNISESTHIEPLADIPVLFIDELGKGRDKKNDFELRIIDEIINRRYLNPDLTTIFASNYRDRDTSGYNNYMRAGYGTDTRQWEEFSRKRYKSENFPNDRAFMAYVDQLMKTEHIEDRVSDRTASRILAIAAPTYIDASDYRRNPGI